MKYGLPYKGSKNKLAERIVHLLPKRTHLIDLFCGGCAVTHAALLMKKYEHIHINDVNWMCPTLFLDALAGKYNNETRWISREDFFRLKDTDPYVAVVWSFGNNMRDYLYSKEIEPLKKAIHYAMFFSDYSLGKELGHDLSFIDPIKDMQKRYLAIKHYFNRLGHFQQQSYEGGTMQAEHYARTVRLSTIRGGGTNSGCSQPRVQRDSISILEYGGGETLTDWRQRKDNSVELFSKKKKYKRPSELQHNECRNSLTSLAIPRAATRPTSPQFGGGRFLPITSSVLDYTDVEIPNDSVIYCDIPYENTNVYNKEQGGSNFDYERFYDWACSQTEPVFISSYQMPTDRFDCITEFSHRSTLSATANNLVTERIFVPKGQKERGNTPKQLSLFDDI